MTTNAEAKDLLKGQVLEATPTAASKTGACGSGGGGGSITSSSCLDNVCTELVSVDASLKSSSQPGCLDSDITHTVASCHDTSSTGRCGPSKWRRTGYAERIPAQSNPVARRLLAIMERKRSNLCVSADLTTAVAILELADEVGPYICMLKTHCDIIDDFSRDFVASLLGLAERHDFLIFEDRKFADIGATARRQYAGGIFRIADWAHLVNAHVVAGPAVIDALRQGAQSAIPAKSTALIPGSPPKPTIHKPALATPATPSSSSSSSSSSPAVAVAAATAGLERGLLLLASMSSAGSMLTSEHETMAAKLAVENSDFVAGLVAQVRPLCLDCLKLENKPSLGSSSASAPAAASSSAEDGSNLSGIVFEGTLEKGYAAGCDGKTRCVCHLLVLTPGIALDAEGDALGQLYRTPRAAINEAGADVLIVGRGIYESMGLNTAEKAAMYQKSGWDAHIEALENACMKKHKK